MRFRVDGTAYEIDELPKLKKAEKHDIDVVVDRLKVTADIAAAPGRELRGGAAHRRRPRHRAGRWTAAREHLFPANSPARCAYSLPELEPRLFSFNSPVGACPTCDGLGPADGVRPERVVAFPRAWSAAGGGRAGTAATPTPFAAGERGARTTVRHRRTLRGTARRHPRRCCCTARRRQEIEFTSTYGGRQAGSAWSSDRSTLRRASCRTWSGATARPTPARCARNPRYQEPASPAPTARFAAAARGGERPGRRPRRGRPRAI